MDLLLELLLELLLVLLLVVVVLLPPRRVQTASTWKPTAHSDCVGMAGASVV